MDYEGELLFQGASDDVVITLLKDEFDGACRCALVAVLGPSSCCTSSDFCCARLLCYRR